MNAVAKGLVVLLSTSFLWGCTTTPDSTETDAAVSTAVETGVDTNAETDTMATAQTSGAEVHAMGAGEVIPVDPFNDSSNLLSQQTIYFDFDQSDIRSESRDIIEAHARYIANNPSARVTLQGHGDERGTREYNLSLGERRARAVKQMMSLLGASGSQLDMVSYGEEKPVVFTHDEAAWRVNRRVEIIYNGR